MGRITKAVNEQVDLSWHQLIIGKLGVWWFWNTFPCSVTILCNFTVSLASKINCCWPPFTYFDKISPWTTYLCTAARWKTDDLRSRVPFLCHYVFSYLITRSFPPFTAGRSMYSFLLPKAQEHDLCHYPGISLAGARSFSIFIHGTGRSTFLFSLTIVGHIRLKYTSKAGVCCCFWHWSLQVRRDTYLHAPRMPFQREHIHVSERRLLWSGIIIRYEWKSAGWLDWINSGVKEKRMPYAADLS